MVPSVASGVMRRRGQSAVRPARSPIRLAFEVRTVAGGAILHVDTLPEQNIRSISFRTLIGRPPKMPSTRDRRRHENSCCRGEQTSLNLRQLRRPNTYLASARTPRTRRARNSSPTGPIPQNIPPLIVVSCIMSVVTPSQRYRRLDRICYGANLQGAGAGLVYDQRV